MESSTTLVYLFFNDSDDSYFQMIQCSCLAKIKVVKNYADLKWFRGLSDFRSCSKVSSSTSWLTDFQLLIIFNLSFNGNYVVLTSDEF